MAPPVAAATSLAMRAVAGASRRLLLARAFAAGTEPDEAAATAVILNRAGALVNVATANPPRDDGLVVEAAYGAKLVADGRVADLEGEAFDLIALPVMQLLRRDRRQRQT